MIEKYGPDWEVVVGGVGIKVNGENDKENEDLVYFWLKKGRLEGRPQDGNQGAQSGQIL